MGFGVIICICRSKTKLYIFTSLHLASHGSAVSGSLISCKGFYFFVACSFLRHSAGMVCISVVILLIFSPPQVMCHDHWKSY